MRVLLVDDHPITRQGLRAALAFAEDLEVVGEAGSGSDAVDAVERLRPDVAFMDLRMPGSSGIEAARQIHERYPATKVVIFTVDESRASLAEALRAGVSGYLLKDVGPDELIDAARLVMAGETCVHPRLQEAYRDELEAMAREARERESEPAPVQALTALEIRILKQVAQGATASQLAARFGMSQEGLRADVDRIFEKLSATDRAQAVAIAVRRRLID
jgi:DNA-binding NarL/FixJ family response regulator